MSHNRNNCKGVACESHLYCGLKDKHPELKKSVSEGQKIVSGLKKNLDTARQELEQFKMQITRARGNFFAIMRPRLKQIDPIKYLHRQSLDKDLLILQKALGKTIPPEADDWKLAHVIECYKRQCTPYYDMAVNTQSTASHVSQSAFGSSLSTATTTSTHQNAPVAQQIVQISSVSEAQVNQTSVGFPPSLPNYRYKPY